MHVTPAHAERESAHTVVVEDPSWHELLSRKAIDAIPDVGPHDSDAVAYWLVQLGAGLLAAVVARAVADPARLAAMATMSLTGRSLMAAFAVDVVALAAEGSRKQAGV
jgi:hypothetical protein